MNKYEKAVHRYYEAVRAKKKHHSEYLSFLRQFESNDRGLTILKDYEAIKECRIHYKDEWGYTLSLEKFVDGTDDYDIDLTNTIDDLKTLIGFRKRRHVIRKEIGYARIAIYKLGESMNKSMLSDICKMDNQSKKSD